MANNKKKYPNLFLPDSVERETVKISSNGVKLDGEIYRPKSMDSRQQLPAIILTHGWGGDKSSAERYAAKFSDAGMISLCFSHAGWGNSDGHAVVIDHEDKLDSSGERVARVRLVRELVDPLEWIQSFRSAVDYIQGEPGVDANRIGAWGTSFGGGIAAHNAANDDRIKVLAVQVPKLSGIKGNYRVRAQQRAISIARGNEFSVPQGIDLRDGLEGTPHLAHFLAYNPLGEMHKINIPTLIIDAERDELFDIKENGGSAFQLLSAREGFPVKYEIIEGIDHYGVYFEGYEESSDLALSWFLKYI